MKRIIVLILTLCILMPCAFADIDLSGLTFEELVALRSQIQLEMMARDDWQSVTVPVGLWQIGVDIPVGHYSFKAIPDYSGFLDISIAYGDVLNDTKTDLDAFKSSFYAARSFDQYKTDFDLDLQTGYVMIKNGPVIFTPYTGKPDLGFK